LKEQRERAKRLEKKDRVEEGGERRRKKMFGNSLPKKFCVLHTPLISTFRLIVTPIIAVTLIFFSNYFRNSFFGGRGRVGKTEIIIFCSSFDFF
jgi:hypothetical protein